VVLSGLGVSLLIATIAGWLLPDLGAAALMGVAVLNIGITVLYGGRVHDIFRRVSSSNRRQLSHCLQMFRLIADLGVAAPRLVALKDDVEKRGGGAVVQIRKRDG
jgi:hypothetical protein